MQVHSSENSNEISSDIEERLATMHSDIVSSGEEIEKVIASLYSSSIDLRGAPIDLKKDPRMIVPVLRQDLSSILDEQSKISALCNLGNICSSSGGGGISFGNTTSGGRSMDLIKYLDQVCKISDLALECDTLIGGCNIIKAAKSLLCLESELKTLPSSRDNEVGSGHVCQSLRREASLLRSSFVLRLDRLLNSSVSIEFGKIVVNKTLKGEENGSIHLDTPIHLNDIWQCFVELNCVNQKVSSIVTKLWQFILVPLWKEKKNVPMESVSSELSTLLFNVSDIESSATSNTILSKSSRQLKVNLGPCKMPLHKFLESINQIMSFVYLEVCCYNEGLQQALSSEFINDSSDRYPSLIDSLKSAILSLIPKSESELKDFQFKLEKPSREFEQRLEKFGFVSKESISSSLMSGDEGGNFFSSSSSSSSTSSFLNQMDMLSLFSENRRSEALEKARQLILSNYHNIMMAYGDAREDSCDIANGSSAYSIQPLQFEPCQVSHTAWNILKHIHDVSKEACASSTNVAQVMFLTCRDIIELFMSVASTEYADIIQSKFTPKMGAVFFNDCIYIAHNTTLIVHSCRAHRDDMHELLEVSAPLVDLIPRLRECGGKILSGHVENQKRVILEFVSRLNINTEQETTLKPVFGHLLGRAASIATSFVAPLPSHAGSTLIMSNSPQQNDISVAKDIASKFEEYSKEWKEVLQRSSFERVVGFLLDTLYRAVTKPIMSAKNITVTSCMEIGAVMELLDSCRNILDNSRPKEELESLIPSLRRFNALSDLLKMSMDAIAEQLPKQKFSCFTTSEFIDLLKAIFDDVNGKRSALIAQIK